MDTFEEQENPFDTDNRNLSSQASSSTKLNISEPSSTPPTDHYSLPTSPYDAFPQQQKADHWLQSSDDVEILVRGRVYSYSAFEASARHPILSNERVFHRFLDGEVSWVR